MPHHGSPATSPRSQANDSHPTALLEAPSAAASLLAQASGFWVLGFMEEGFGFRAFGVVRRAWGFEDFWHKGAPYPKSEHRALG